jgi:transposase
MPIRVEHERCCGIDVHKDSVTACVLLYEDSPQPQIRRKEFQTHSRALETLNSWLKALKVTQVAMESTGVYWKPVWYALESQFQLLLFNPYQVKNMPGKKTDKRASQWLAELLAHGLVQGSFVPPAEARALRDLTRYRVRLTEQMNRISNRIHKVLEDACLKLDTVATHILGVSGRKMIKAIIEGEQQPNQLAEHAEGKLREKLPALRLALRGDVTEHHRFLLKELLEDLEFVEMKILRLDQAIVQRVDMNVVLRLCTMPGVDVITAWTLLAELGTDMRVFPTAKDAASWAGLCPGNNESAGKRLSNRTRKGNRWLRRALCQSAWGASRKKNCFLAAFFQRQKAKGGTKKALMATAHRMLIIAYCMLRDGTDYRELGGDY